MAEKTESILIGKEVIVKTKGELYASAVVEVSLKLLFILLRMGKIFRVWRSISDYELFICLFC